jgi:hypothetical protein
MLDVHPAHHAATTWRDFFIHIATIVLGLLIAIGLEQTVEFFHHRHEAEHAREMIADEMAINDNLQQQDLYILTLHEDYLFQDLSVIDRLRHHALLPGDHVIIFRPTQAFKNSAWLTAQQSGALALFPYDEIQRYAYVYGMQSDFEKTADESSVALQNANTMFYRSAADRFDYSHSFNFSDFAGKHGLAVAHQSFEDQAPGVDKLNSLTPVQIDRLEQTIQEAIFQDEHLINRCKWLHDGYNSSPSGNLVQRKKGE